ncbi:MAG: nitrate ABC transporter, permease protein, partial [Gemmatimonadales bacterium]|nr:nitrate ABC transporter, permease protein [Gemmatimonadales bacterium]
MVDSSRLRALALSALLFVLFIAIWSFATGSGGGAQTVDDEYAKLVGTAAASGQQSSLPGPGEVGAKIVEHLANPFYDAGPN